MSDPHYLSFIDKSKMIKRRNERQGKVFGKVWQAIKRMKKKYRGEGPPFNLNKDIMKPKISFLGKQIAKFNNTARFTLIE